MAKYFPCPFRASRRLTSRSRHAINNPHHLAGELLEEFLGRGSNKTLRGCFLSGLLCAGGFVVSHNSRPPVSYDSESRLSESMLSSNPAPLPEYKPLFARGVYLMYAPSDYAGKSN